MRNFVNGPNMRLRMEAIKSTSLLRSYSTSPMVLALAIVVDLALPLYGVSNCVWLAVSSCIRVPRCMGERDGLMLAKETRTPGP